MSQHRTFRRPGVVAVLVAVCLVAIMSIMALAIDGGLLLDQRRDVQAAADSAALAAAAQLWSDWATGQGQDRNGKASATALLTASANGFNNDTVTNTVTVHIPPTSGFATGLAGYAEVLIQYQEKRYFSAMFGSADIPVNGRAVARGKKNSSDIGVLLLNPTAQGALTLSGQTGMSVAGRVVVDSNNSKAAVSSGSAGLTSTVLDVTGGINSSGSSYFHASTINTGAAGTSDFLSGVPTPSTSGLTTQSLSTYSAAAGETLQPGIYVGGITISSKPNVTFAPGTYYLQGGGLTMSGGSSSLTALEVMIYNGANSSGSVGKVTLSGGGAVQMSPPKGGDYAGMAIFQDRTSTQPITLSGGSTWDFKGTVYGAKAHVDVSGGSGARMGSQYVSDTLTLSGSSTFQDIDPRDGYGPKDIRLVE
jgi:hypothetical protein